MGRAVLARQVRQLHVGDFRQQFVQIHLVGVVFYQDTAGQLADAHAHAEEFPQLLHDLARHTRVAVQTTDGDPCVVQRSRYTLMNDRRQRLVFRITVRFPIVPIQGRQDGTLIGGLWIEADQDIAGQRVGLDAADTGQFADALLHAALSMAGPVWQVDADSAGNGGENVRFAIHLTDHRVTENTEKNKRSIIRISSNLLRFFIFLCFFLSVSSVTLWLGFLISLAFANGLGLSPDVFRFLAGSSGPFEDIVANNRYVMADLLPQAIYHFLGALHGLAACFVCAGLRLLLRCSIGIGCRSGLRFRATGSVLLHGCPPRPVEKDLTGYDSRRRRGLLSFCAGTACGRSSLLGAVSKLTSRSHYLIAGRQQSCQSIAQPAAYRFPHRR